MAPNTRLSWSNSMIGAGASDSEDDLAVANRGAENKRMKSALSKKSSSTARRTSMPKANAASKRKAPVKQNRQALQDRTNMQDGSDTEEVENFDEEQANGPRKTASKRAKTETATKQPAARATHEASKSRTTTRVPAARTLDVIPETQTDPEQMEDVTQTVEMGQGDMSDPVVPAKPSRVAPRARSASVQPLQPLQPRPSARAASVQPGYPQPRDRSASASGTERERRGNDPELRRKLTDMTKKYETLNLKYSTLQDIGQNSAQNNFEQLKRASDQKAKDAAELIASLKKEVQDLKKTNTSQPDTTALQKQLTTITNTNTNLKTEQSNLKNSLQVAQNEVKSLEAKLVAARQQLSTAAPSQETTKAGAENTTKNSLNRSVGPNATDAQKDAKMKENLYSDLTGLIIRSVKRKEGEDEYDCIQTGRNGTLHFHLTIANDAAIANPKTPTGLTYEEAEFAYEPHLDQSRDHELIELLPDYLTEDICFPRNHAVKFYTRVVDSMTKKIVIED